MVWSPVADASEAWAGKEGHPFFDGIDDSLNLGDIFDQTGDYTIEAEINPSALQAIDGSIGGGMRILSKDTQSLIGWAFSIGDGDTPGRLRSFNRSATGSGVVDADGVIVANVWQHVAVSFDVAAQLATLYKDGVQVGQGDVDAAAVDNVANLAIGSGGVVPIIRHFYGKMRNVRLWNVARTGPEILANKNKTISAGTAGLDLQEFAWEDKAAASESFVANAEHPFFDGIDDSLNLGDVHDQLGSYTMEADIYPFALTGTPANPQMRIIWKVKSGTIGFFLSVGSSSLDGRIRSQQRNATDKGQVQFVGSLVANVWQHVAYTFELSTLIGRLFYDGVQKKQETLLAANPVVANDMFVGSGKSGLGFFNGRMRNVRIWNVQRTEPEILANMNRAVPADSPGLDLQRFAWTDKATASSSWSAV